MNLGSVLGHSLHVIKIQITKINAKKVKRKHRVLDTDRQTATLNCGKSTTWEMKPRMTPQKTSRLLMGPEQVMRPKTLMVMMELALYTRQST
jgi:hypothetical protein